LAQGSFYRVGEAGLALVIMSQAIER
jgi:hypothetical protein